MLSATSVVAAAATHQLRYICIPVDFGKGFKQFYCLASRPSGRQAGAQYKQFYWTSCSEWRKEERKCLSTCVCVRQRELRACLSNEFSGREETIQYSTELEYQIIILKLFWNHYFFMLSLHFVVFDARFGSAAATTASAAAHTRTSKPTSS